MKIFILDNLVLYRILRDFFVYPGNYLLEKLNNIGFIFSLDL